MFNRGIARVQKDLVDNGNGKAQFTVNKVTVFSVNVINAKSQNVSIEISNNTDISEFNISDNSLAVLQLCAQDSYCKKVLLQMIGVTNQTLNVRNIINPLIKSGCIAPIAEDKDKVKSVRYAATERGLDYLKLKKNE